MDRKKVNEGAMQVYLIRDAQCELNLLLDGAPLNKRLSRNAFNALLHTERESPLTPEGRVQAQHLAQRLANIRFDHLYTSPLSRALATAVASSKTTGLTPQIIN